MSKTYKDKAKYYIKQIQNHSKSGQINALGAPGTTISKKVGKSKPFTQNDLTLRNMDPRGREMWRDDPDQYTIHPGLDEWLMFGFPNILITKRIQVIWQK